MGYLSVLHSCTETAEQELDRILEETGIGRVTTDPYELREAHRMTDRSRQ